MENILITDEDFPLYTISFTMGWVASKESLFISEQWEDNSDMNE